MATQQRNGNRRKGAGRRSTQRNGRPPGGRAPSRKKQAERQATAAKKKTDERREQQAGGLSGWVAERAGKWTLQGVDHAWMERQKYVWNPIMDYWFRMEMEGWEWLPDPPALLVGIHSGGPFVWDAWTVGIQWWRRFGHERPLHGTAHDALMAAPGLGAYFRKMGVLPAAPDSMSAALATGHDVALWPGGEVDSLRRWTQRDEAILAGRTGFLKLAIRAAVPIVPIATVGGPDGMPVIASGRRIAKTLKLDKMLRLKRFPIALSVPWGVAPALLPEVPLPAKIRTAFQAPIELDRDPGRADDDRYLDEKYREVRDSIQSGMDALARRRALPLFG